jgi:hypothetical protein
MARIHEVLVEARSLRRLEPVLGAQTISSVEARALALASASQVVLSGTLTPRHPAAASRRCSRHCSFLPASTASMRAGA